MPLANYLRRLLVACVAPLAIAGCCDAEAFDTVSLGVGSEAPSTGPSTVSPWLGDRVTVTGHAWRSPNEFCGGDGDRYTSTTNPSAFKFRSSDPTVATISASGTLTTLSLGETDITATTGGIIGSVHVVVIVPVASVRITVAPLDPHPNDTVTFRGQAFDAAGAPIAGRVGVTLNGSPALPCPCEGSAARTIAVYGQRIYGTATVPHDGVPSSSLLWATVNVTVTPAPP